MESIWFKPELSAEIMNNDAIFTKTTDIVADITEGKTDISNIVENMAGVLASEIVENRVKGMQFFTKILKELPKDYLTEKQLQFISTFYKDRLRDNHRVIPHTLEGYLEIIEMQNYCIKDCSEFLLILFKEVPCQSQVREDRRKIYSIIQRLLEINLAYMITLGPELVYGSITAMEGERDPRNLLFLFTFLPKFIANIPLGHLVEEMFEVVSCYYPIDFHPSPNDPEAVKRDELAQALAPCLCATPRFAEHCLPLLIEKLDSNLRVAKLDSLKLLRESCKKFEPKSYSPFLRTLWSSINREITNKTDEELRMCAHEALSDLVAKLATSANTDQDFESFIKGIIISGQTSIAEATTFPQFLQAKNILMTCANASKESCILIVSAMIPALISYYSFCSIPKLQLASVYSLGDMYDVSKHWNCIVELNPLLRDIPQACLTCVSEQSKEYQITGLKTLTKVIKILDNDLVLPFIDILIHIIQHSTDDELLAVSVETIHAIATIFPEFIMELVVKKQCDLKKIPMNQKDLEKKLYLLCNLARVDDFTKVIIEDMLQIVADDNESGHKVVEALSCSISDVSLYKAPKIEQIENDHGLVKSIITWLEGEMAQPLYDIENGLGYGFSLIKATMSSLPIEKQQTLIDTYVPKYMEMTKTNNSYFSLLESLLNSIQQKTKISKQDELVNLILKISLESEKEIIRKKAAVLLAHFLNKAEYGDNFEIMYDNVRNYLVSYDKRDKNLCPKLINLYAWITKGLIVRGSDLFSFWLQKIAAYLNDEDHCLEAAKAIKLIMDDSPVCLTTSQHCRVSIFYKQRFFLAFSNLEHNFPAATGSKVRLSRLLSWAFVLEHIPRSVLITQVEKFAPLVTESLDVDNKPLLLVMLEILLYLINSKQMLVADSLQTILPKLVKLTQYKDTMEVRIKSLRCIHDIAENYSTVLLLPYKSDLLLELAPSLDDKKRLVRNMAVKSRARWFLVGAPGEKEN